jgi:hypothetical protein
VIEVGGFGAVVLVGGGGSGAATPLISAAICSRESSLRQRACFTVAVL